MVINKINSKIIIIIKIIKAIIKSISVIHKIVTCIYFKFDREQLIPLLTMS